LSGNGASLCATVTANTERLAQDLAPVAADIRTSGHATLRAIASELTGRGIQTRRVGAWGVSSVGNLLKRIEEINAGDAPSPHTQKDQHN